MGPQAHPSAVREEGGGPEKDVGCKVKNPVMGRLWGDKREMANLPGASPKASSSVAKAQPNMCPGLGLLGDPVASLVAQRVKHLLTIRETQV